jgi:hypothetical protein
MEILILMSLLLIKHCYADFKIQTYQQTVRKGIYRDPVGISHSVDHVWTTLVMLIAFSLFVQPISALLILAIALAEGMIHYHVDWVKVRFGCKDITKPQFWAQFGYDQLAHLLTYVAMCAIILL